MARNDRPVSGIHAPAPRITRMGAVVLAIALAAPVWTVLTIGEIIWRIAAP